MSDDAFALDNFAPPEFTKFRLRKHPGQDFRIDGDPDTGDIALMLKIEDKLLGETTENEMFAASEEGKELILRLIREHNPEVSEIKIGMQEVLILFSLIIRGPSVAAGVAKAIAPNAAEPDAERKDGEQTAHQEGEPNPETAEVAPLASAKLSSDRSSNSAEETVGLLATGTA